MPGQSDPHELLKTILRGTAPLRPLFLPIVFSHAARIENLSLRTFLTNPTKITQALRQIRAHLRSDSLTCYFDPYLEVEALGGILEWGEREKRQVRWPRNPGVGNLPDGLCAADEVAGKGRVPAAVEVIRRLKSLVRDECLLTAGISGPFALAAQLLQINREASGEAEISSDALELASEAAASIAKSFLEAGANSIFICEDLPSSPAGLPDLASLLATTVNIIRFYQALPVLLLSCESRNLSPAFFQNLDCVVCPVLSETLPARVNGLTKPAPANLGLAIPVSEIAKPPASFERFVAGIRSLVIELQPAVITTSGDVPPTAELRNLNTIRDSLIV
jgi:uroporphyrinogen decarboxylase-like protein